MTFPHAGHLRRLADRLGCRTEEVLDFSASINPLGPPETLRAVVGRTLDQIVHYPDPECDELVRTPAQPVGVSAPRDTRYAKEPRQLNTRKPGHQCYLSTDGIVIDFNHQILIAVALDLLVGDPRWLPHPVKLIGRLAVSLESPARTFVPTARLAGTVTAFLVIAISGIVAWAIARSAAWFHPWAGDVVSILLIYTCIAARDLAAHGTAVFRPLNAGDLHEARRRVGIIVGRDTDRLDEAGIARATVESIAENLVDGVTAPLFFAAIFGPVGAIVYKAINTLDSTFGYKNERYVRFGWAAALIDDVANYVPARLTAPLVALAALVLGERPLGALRILLRDRGRHTSPNAGYPEAAFAGALGIQLGGPSFYFGQDQPIVKPLIGDPLQRLESSHIRKANLLMVTAAALFVAVCVCARVAADQLLSRGGWAL